MLFPYKLRVNQKQIIDLFVKCLNERKHLILESGTGSGKTICALTPTLEFALKNNKKILYLTRTNSQQRQVISELRQILKKINSESQNLDGKSSNKFNDEVANKNNIQTSKLKETLEKNAVKNHSETMSSQENNFSQSNKNSNQNEMKSFKIILENKILGVAIQGRHNLCPLTKEDKEFEESNSEELAKMCSDRKRNTLKVLRGEEVFPICKYFSNSQTSNILAYKDWAKENLPSAEELISYCVEREVCPFEVNKILLEDAIVITSPYIYFFDFFIRKNLLEWMGCNIEDIILIVDEAHNLPDYARELLSSYLSIRMLNTAIEEAREFSDAQLINEIKISEFFDKIKEIMLKIEKEFVFGEIQRKSEEVENFETREEEISDKRILQNEKIVYKVHENKEKKSKLPDDKKIPYRKNYESKEEKYGEDGLVPSEELERELMSSYKITSNRLQQAVNDLLIHGELIQNIKRRRNKLPRSYIHSVAEFLENWLKINEEQYVKLVVSGENPRLEIFCLDASLITSEVKKCYCSFHMSGTLLPLEEYRDTIGLRDVSLMQNFSSPFPKENKKVLFVKDVSTRYEELEKNLEKLNEYVLKICNSFNKNTIVFFPSFSLLEGFLKSAREKIKRNFYKEEKGLSQEELMLFVNDFKAKKNSVFLSVIGGRISEGLDFPAEELEIAILYGIPYPKPTAKQKALLNYYDIKFGKGLEYTVNAPTLRKMLQSIGRLIRSENDRGVAVILDKRAVHFRKLDAKEVGNVVKEIESFFEK